jgi:hypothetical protein
MEFRTMILARLPNWTNCVVEVEDIGRLSFWGKLVDRKEDLVINPHAIFDKKGKWIFEVRPEISLDYSVN